MYHLGAASNGTRDMAPAKRFVSRTGVSAGTVIENHLMPEITGTII